MRKKWTRIVVAVLVIVLVLPMLPGANVLATEEGYNEQVEAKEEIEKQDFQNNENNVNENQQDAANSSNIKNETTNEQSQSNNAAGLMASSGLLNYLYVEQPYIETPAEQNVVVSYGDGTEDITEMYLICQKSDGNIFRMPLTKRDSELFLFSHTFANSDTGVYQVKQIIYTLSGSETTIELSNIGVEAQFGVNEQYTGFGSDGIEAEDIDMSVVQLDGNESIEETEQSVTEALEQTEAIIEPDSTVKARNGEKALRRAPDGDLIIVLDPGHGGWDSGAVGNGLQEKNINLKIAQYCKAELEQYSGVKVYMTRDRDVALSPTPGDRSGDLNKRVQVAKNYGADALVSIHINSFGSSSAHGAEVWYPNKNYNLAIHQQGAELAQRIQNQLTALGLANRGIQEKSTREDKYPDGSLQDWYAIIRNSKLNGFPGIIVEHAFISSPSDVNNYLGSDAKLQQLGVADATGIANCYGLSKGKPKVEILNKNDFAGTSQIKITGCGNQSYAAVWSAGDQSNIVWYPITGNNYTLNFDIKNHKNMRGNYNVHVYNSSLDKVLFDTTFKITKDTDSKITVTDESGTETRYKVNLNFADMPAEVSAVRFPTWSDPSQKDIIWHEAKQVSKGKWEATVNINDHRLSGKYIVHAYVRLQSGAEVMVGATDFTVTEPSKPNLQVTNYNKKLGTFEVIVNGFSYPSGVSNVKIPIWCQNDQSDIVWYDAKKQTDGSYKASVSIANHKYSTGLYKIHMYLTTGNGLSVFNAITLGVEIPDVGVIVQDTNGKETAYAMKITNAGILGDVRQVSFAVWSTKNGQDDLVWYNASKNINGTWTSTANINNHRTEGTYNVHVYATLSSGVQKFVGNTSFEVAGPGKSDLTVTNYKKEAGTFDVTVKGITTPSGVESVKIPVWCQDNQSDIVWYDAKKQSDGSYKVNVSIANHKYSTGLYKIHMYLTTGNGQTLFSSTTQGVDLPSMGISAEDTNGKETTYAMKITNTGLLGEIHQLSFAVWSTKSGQDDLIWYNGSKDKYGTWTATANINNHRTEGTYNVHVYATLSSGIQKFVGDTSFEVAGPGKSGLTVTNYKKDAGTFDVIVKGVATPSGVNSVSIPVWCQDNQSDIVWYDAKKQTDGSFKVNVSIANHKYSTGLYKIHMYLTTGNGQTLFNATTQGVELPNIGVGATDTNGKETTYTMKITNAGVMGNIRQATFAVWSNKDDQDDLIWYDASRDSNGTWTATANINNHRTEGTYSVHAYVTLADGTQKFVGSTDFAISGDISANISTSNYNDASGAFKIQIKNIKSVSGVSRIQVPTWCSSNQSDIKWYEAQRQPDGSYAVNIDPVNHNFNLGVYQSHIYLTTGNGIVRIVGAVNQLVKATNAYTIMGETSVTVDQMVKYFQKSGRAYPSGVLGSGGAGDVRTFCTMYVQEASAEGVRADVAFTQAMKETAWLQYGNIVKVEQFNFAGIGALDGNAQGNCASFPDVRTGIRAQIQHLKAYGSREALKNPCVDPRFHLVTRYSSPYVEWLGIPNNPYGKGWATSNNYGYDIVAMIKALKFL